MSPEQILQLIFGGEITVDSIGNIFAVVYGVVMSVVAAKSRNKAITADRQASATEVTVANQTAEITQLKEAIGYLGNMMASTFLSSQAVNPETKQLIANYATKIQTVAAIPLTTEVSKLVDAVHSYVPGLNLAAKKDEITAATTKVESTLDAISETASSIVAGMKL